MHNLLCVLIQITLTKMFKIDEQQNAKSEISLNLLHSIKMEHSKIFFKATSDKRNVMSLVDRNFACKCFI